MGDTVLTSLRKLNHPTMIQRIKSVKERLIWTDHSSFRSATISYRYFTRAGIAGLDVTLGFHHTQEMYEFYMFDDAFYMDRLRTSKYLEYVHDKNTIDYKKVAELVDIKYTNLEEMIFQQSLLHDLGMFGAQEAEQISKLSNQIFGEQRESKTK